MSEIEAIFNEREREFLHEAMAQKDMSAAGVIRHFFRLGQMVDHFMTQKNNKLRFLNPATGEIIDPFDAGQKLAPKDKIIPAIFDVKEHINCACWATGKYSRVEGCSYHPYDL